MNRETYLICAAFLVLASGAACKYENRPAAGAMICGSGSKSCPDNYACYRGTVGSNCTGTCWPAGKEPDAATVCSHGGVPPDDMNHSDSGAGGTDGNTVDVPMDTGAGDRVDAPDAPRDMGGAGGRTGDGGDSPDMGSSMGTPASLSISPGMNDFSTVVAGVSAEASFQVSNSGGQPSSVPMVTIDGTDAALFTVATTTCTAAVPATQSCVVTVRFSPPTTATGAKSARLNVSATLGGAVTATLQGTVVPPGALTITPTTQSFGSVLQATAGTPASFTVKNTGGAATGALTAVVQNSTELAISTDGCKTKMLASAETCVIAVTFTPASSGQKSGTLVVSGTPGGTASASLTGVGLAPAALAINPVSGSFAATSVGATGAAQTFTITNSGGVAAGGTTAVAAVVGGTNPADFVASANTCTGTLMPGASCMVTITFRPSAAGTRAATLTATATPGGSAPAPLTGTGVNPALLKLAVAAGASINFGSVVTGTPATQTFTLTNMGGQASSAVTVAAAGAGFSVVAPAAGDCVSGTTTLAVNASCTVHVLLSSTTVGAVSGSITASASAGGSSALTLSGTIVSQGSISLSPKTAAFGSFLPGVSSVASSFTVTNDGGSTTPVLATAITGSTEFTISADACNTKTLVAGASCSVSVVFKPATSGAKTGSLSVSAGIAGSASATLTGTGLVPATLGISAATGFGSVVVGQTSTAQALTVTNSGDAAAGTTTVISSALSGTNSADFAVTGTTCTATLAAKSTCTVSVAFRPMSAGAGKTATLTVSGAPGGAPTASLTGTGLAPASLHLSVASGFSNEFGSPVSGTGTQTEQFVVTNTGQQASSALTVGLTGTDFRLVAPTGLDCVSAPAATPTVLAPNATCTVRVTFAPTAAVSRTATLSVSATTGGSDSLATLHGTGVAPSALTVSASTLNLGTVLTGGKSLASSITVSNTGGVATAAIATSLPAGEFAIATDGCKGMALPPSGSCMISLTFAPVSASATPKAGTLTVSAGADSRTVSLSGTGTTLKVDQTSFTFPPTPTATSGPSRSFTVTNPTSGSAGTTTALSVTLTGTNSFDFLIGSNTCTGVLGGTGLCSVVVSFAPGGQSFGPRTATLNVTANPGGTAVVALSAQGQAQDGQFGCVNNDDCLSTACVTYYRDVDGDTYGDITKPVQVCGFTTPNGYVSQFGTPDCNDADATMFPFATHCLNATTRTYCLGDGIVRTQACTGGGCRENYCVGTAGIAGTFTCSSGLSCTSAQGCTYTTSVVNPAGAPPACSLQNTGGSIITCDGGDDCGPGQVCCTDYNCGLSTLQQCFTGSCPPSVQCTPWGQVCNPLAPDCQGGLRCVGGFGDVTTGQGSWGCTP